MSSDIVLALIASGTIATLLNLIVTGIKEIIDRRRGLKASMRIILDDRLCTLAEKYLREGEISQTNLKVYTKMHEAYKHLGGNGYHDKLIVKLENLPTKGENDD